MNDHSIRAARGSLLLEISIDGIRIANITHVMVNTRVILNNLILLFLLLYRVRIIVASANFDISRGCIGGGHCEEYGRERLHRWDKDLS